ncbi:MAG: FtsX-like permease family protein [Ktedonobacteraceae bacterium]|nr:FtsX-like permease family protein [Chloroflexota bacterium]
MQAIMFKIRLDLRSHKLQNLSLIILVALSSFLVSLSLLAIINANAPFNRLFQQLHGADTWLYVSSPRVPSSVLTIVGKNPSTTEISSPFPAISTGIIFAGSKQQVMVVGLPAEQPSIGQLFLVQGHYLTTNTPDGVVIDEQLASEDNLRVGNTITLVTPSGPKALPIIGLSIDANHGAAGSDQPRIYVLEQQFSALFAGSAQQITLIGIRIANPSVVHLFESHLGQQLLATGAQFGFFSDWVEISDSYTQYFNIEVIFFLAFGFVAIIVSGFIILNLITGLVLAQRRDIGILKVLGFTPAQIVGIYLFQYVALTLAAALIGVVASLFVAPVVLSQAASALYTTPISSFNPLLLFLVILGMGLIVAIFAVFPAWRAGHISCVSAIRGSFHAGSRGFSRLADLAGRFHFPEIWIIGMGQSFARPWRAWLTILSLIAMICTMIFSIGIFSTIDASSTPPAQGIFSSVLVTPGLFGEEATRQLLAAQQDTVSYYTILGANFSVNHTSNYLPMQLLGGDTSPIRSHLVQGRWYNIGAKEMVLPLSTLNKLNLHIGDLVQLGKPLNLAVRIVGTYSAIYAGAPALADQTLFPATFLAHVQNDTTFAVTLAPTVNTTAWTHHILAESGDRVNVIVQNPNPPAQIEALKVAMFLPTAILALVALVSVLNTMLITVRERFHEFGVLKALGMTPHDIQVIIQTSTANYAIIACLLGFPLGILLTSWIFQITANALGYGVAQTSINALWLFLLFPASLLLVLLGSYVPGRRAARASTAEILRME